MHDADAGLDPAYSGDDSETPLDGNDLADGQVSEADSSDDAAPPSSDATAVEPQQDAAVRTFDAGTSDDAASPGFDASPQDGAMLSSDAAPSDADAGNSPDTDGGATDGGASDASRSAALGSCGDVHASGDVLLDLYKIGQPQLSSNRLASIGAQRWLLWDTVSADLIAQGSVSCVDNFCGVLSEKVLVVRQASSLSLRDPRDGHELGTIPIASGTRVGTTGDGGFVWTADQSALYLWSLSAQPLGSVTGDYRNASIYSSESALRVALGPAGAQRIETIAAPGLARTTSEPFAGAFQNWFEDGLRFITGDGTNLSIYATSSAALEKQYTLSRWAAAYGKGDYFWTYVLPYGAADSYYYRVSTGESVYQLGKGNKQIFSRSPILYAPAGASSLTVVEFDAQGPNYRFLRVYDLPWFRGVATNKQGDVVIVGGEGAASLYRAGASTPQLIGCGKLLDLDVVNNGRWVATFSNGQTVLGDLSARQSAKVLAESAVKVRLTADGQTLGAFQNSSSLSDSYAVSLSLIATDTGVRLGTWQGSRGTAPYLIDFELSGDRLLRSFVTSATGVPTVTRDVLGDFLGSEQAAIAGDGSERLRLSPSGRKFTVSVAAPAPLTRIYDAQGALLGTAAGIALVWLDDQRVLLQVELADDSGRRSEIAVIDTTGQRLATTALPDQDYGNLRSLAGGTRVFSSTAAGIYDLTHTAPLWQPASPWTSAAADDTQVLYYVDDPEHGTLRLATPSL